MMRGPRIRGGMQPMLGRGASMPLNGTNVGRRMAKMGMAGAMPKVAAPKRMVGVRGGKSPKVGTPRGVINR